MQLPPRTASIWKCLPIDQRAVTYRTAYIGTKPLAQVQSHSISTRDKDGRALDGARFTG
jgi:hypothetical protein